MKNYTKQMNLWSIGKRSPVLKVYNGNLRRAYYFTNCLIFLTIVSIFGYVKWQQWQNDVRENELRISPPPVIDVGVRPNMVPPPSIKGEINGGFTTGLPGGKSVAPAVGVPVPVPDDKAIQQTIPTQQNIVSTGVFGSDSGTYGTGIIGITDDPPEPGVFVPHEVEPKFISKPPLIYPSISALCGEEGTVVVQALVDLDGSVMRVVVTRSSGFARLDSAATANAYKWQLRPALQNEKPVRVWISTQVKFKLN